MSVPTPGELKKTLDAQRSKKPSVIETAAKKSTESVSKSVKKTITRMKTPKPKFVLEEHLTQRAFSAHPGLTELSKKLLEMEPPATKRRKPSNAKKDLVNNRLYGKATKKENN